jgi:hypothetical protein
MAMDDAVIREESSTRVEDGQCEDDAQLDDWARAMADWIVANPDAIKGRS